MISVLRCNNGEMRRSDSSLRLYSPAPTVMFGISGAHEAAGLGLGVDHDSQDADAASTAPTPVLSRKATMDPPVVPISLKKSKRGRSATKASLRSTKSSSVAVGSAVPTRSSKALSKPSMGREQMTSTDRQKKRSHSRFRHYESSTIPVARASKFDFE
jgi:hypothetical protein